MQYDFTKFKNKIKEIEDHLKKEFTTVRTGMASPQIFDSVIVESYGQRMPINQVASVTISDPKSVMISPWDVTQIKAIEKALTVANLGVSLKVDEKGVRVFFPDLTGERRIELTKVAKEKFEQAKINLRTAREEILKDIEAQEKLGGMGEDDVFRFKGDLQKMVDAGNKTFEEALSKKEKEILG